MGTEKTKCGASEDRIKMRWKRRGGECKKRGRGKGGQGKNEGSNKLLKEELVMKRGERGRENEGKAT